MAPLYVHLYLLGMIDRGALTEDLGDVRVVHVGTGLQDLPPLVLRPDHERVHRALDMRLAVAVFAWLPDYLGSKEFA